MFLKKRISIFKNYYKDEKTVLRDIDEIRMFYNINKKEEYTIDDQTWNDIDMDRVFFKVDRNYSSLGEASLYYMLRNPKIDKRDLESRDNTIDKIMQDEDLRAKLQQIFFGLGYDKKNRLLDMIEKDFKKNKFKGILYSILGALPIALVILAFFIEPTVPLFCVFILLLSTIGIAGFEQKNINSNGLIYANNILIAARRIINLKLNDVLDNDGKIRALVKDLQYIKKKTRLINIVNMYGGFLEPLCTPFLILESAYYKIINNLEENKDKILELYYELGKIEAYISVGIYKETLEGKYSKPNFVDQIKLEIKEGIHPLVNNPVDNSILLDKKGVVLTGTNMSGKSTFLRMLGVNIVFAQTFNFTLASKYEGSFFNIVSSISPSDDINEGKSYYMAEAEAILRIIKSLDKPIPVFCIIDEIFRGTNPVERVAASAAILNYINDAKALTFVATHDRELTDLLYKSYDFYYFNEEVNSKEGLSFDYKLKRGISKTRNAIKLLDYIGYPKEITKEASKLANLKEKN